MIKIGTLDNALKIIYKKKSFYLEYFIILNFNIHVSLNSIKLIKLIYKYHL